jgi:pimeloyl-ACP methyl ester carboxylesterase
VVQSFTREDTNLRAFDRLNQDNQDTNIHAARLGSLLFPVVQIVGANDPVTRPEGARWLQERLADARLVELTECGHYPLFEARDRFDEVLLEIV